jgi:hypothetical protein
MRSGSLRTRRRRLLPNRSAVPSTCTVPPSHPLRFQGSPLQDRGGPWVCGNSPADVKIRPSQRRLTPAGRTHRPTALDLLQTCPHPARIGQSTVDDRLAETGSQSLSTRIAPQPAAKPLALPLTGHTDVNQGAADPLPDKVDTGKARRLGARQDASTSLNPLCGDTGATSVGWYRRHSAYDDIHPNSYDQPLLFEHEAEPIRNRRPGLPETRGESFHHLREGDSCSANRSGPTNRR